MENKKNKTLWSKVLRISSAMGKLVISLVMSLFMYRIIGGTWGIVLSGLSLSLSLFEFLLTIFNPMSDNDEEESSMSIAVTIGILLLLKVSDWLDISTKVLKIYEKKGLLLQISGLDNKLE